MAQAKSPSKKEKDEITLPDEQEAKARAEEIFAPLQKAQMQSFLMRLQNLSKNAPQVILFEGGNHDLRMASAKHWASILNCTSTISPCLSCVSCLEIANELTADFIVFDGTKESIKIEPMRELKPLISTAPTRLNKRVVLFYEASEFTIPAANSILKILEEPNNTTYFIFTVAQRERILPTLVSRSNVLSLPTNIHEKLNPIEDKIVNDLYVFFTSGKAWFENNTSQKGYSKENALLVIHLLSMHISQSLSQAKVGEHHSLVDYFSKKIDIEKSLKIMTLFEESQNALIEQVNPALIVDSLLTHIFMILNN